MKYNKNKVRKQLNNAAFGIYLNGENVMVVYGFYIPTALKYGALCERAFFEKYLNDIGRERNWTWYSDLSIAEYYIGNECSPAPIIDTVARAIEYWHSDEKCMAEFAMALAVKSYEHQARGNDGLALLYSNLFETVKDVIYDLYEDSPDKTSYFWEYLD